MNNTYYPEGMFPQELQAQYMPREMLKKAYLEGTILEATARSATASHNLLVDLGAVTGYIPRNETAIGIEEGTVRDIAILSRVGKPICFQITSIEGLWDEHPRITLSRRKAQEEALTYLLEEVRDGTILPAVVTIWIGSVLSVTLAAAMYPCCPLKTFPSPGLPTAGIGSRRVNESLPPLLPGT